MANWASSAQAARHWPDSANLDATRLTELLDVATVACRAYVGVPLLAGVPQDPAPIPTNYMLACVYQAREIAAASTRDGDLVGAGDLAYRVKPLTSTVKQLLRPESRGVVG